jgi:hypothetical protein
MNVLLSKVLWKSEAIRTTESSGGIRPGILLKSSDE